MAMTNDDGGGFVFVNFDTGSTVPVGGDSYIVNIGQLDPTEADTLNGCEDWGVYSPEARAIVARHGVSVADLVRPGETGGGGFELGSGGHPEPVRDICGVCGDYLLPESEWTGVGFYFCPNGAKHYENPPEAVRLAITVTFSTDRPLSADEVDALVNALAVQVEEPGTVDNSGEWVRADFGTWDIRTEVVSVADILPDDDGGEE